MKCGALALGSRQDVWGARIAQRTAGSERTDAMSTMRRILFASDFSKASRKALTTAMAMARANRATLTVLHVIVPFIPIVPEQHRHQDVGADRSPGATMEPAPTQQVDGESEGGRHSSRRAPPGGRSRSTNRSGGPIHARRPPGRRHARKDRIDQILRRKRRGTRGRHGVLPGGDGPRSVDESWRRRMHCSRACVVLLSRAAKIAALSTAT